MRCTGRWGASRTGRWWELWEGWERWERWGSPRTPEGGQARKRWWEGAVDCEPHGQMVGAVGAVGAMGRVGIMGIVGGVKRGKLCQNLGTLTKFIY